MSTGIDRIDRTPITPMIMAMTATACGFLSDALIRPFMVPQPLMNGSLCPWGGARVVSPRRPVLRPGLSSLLRAVTLGQFTAPQQSGVDEGPRRPDGEERADLSSHCPRHQLP